MAEVQSESKKRGRQTLKIDFTPMVDLGFLLITFFMLTTVLSKPYYLDLSMPVGDQPMAVSDASALTVILSGDNKIYYYNGMNYDKMQVTGFSKDGIRSILLENNRNLIKAKEALQAQASQLSQEEFDKRATQLAHRKATLMVLIKADDSSSYGNLVDMLDEIQITGVAKYTIATLEPQETEQMAMLGN